MHGHQPLWRRLITGLVVVVGMTVAGTIPVAQADSSVAVIVIPRDASAYGNTYGEWSARWLQRLFAIPAATHPALDTTGAHCAEGQAGPVWFLAGTFGGDPVTRHCSVPVGKALFFPLAAVLFGAGVLDCEPTGPGPCNLVALRVAASAAVEAVQLNASMDGSEAHEAAITSDNQEHGTTIIIRQVPYVNDVVEQDRRGVKRITRPLLGFKIVAERSVR